MWMQKMDLANKLIMPLNANAKSQNIDCLV